MRNFQGIAVSPGVAVGQANVIDNEGIRIPHRSIPRTAVESELARLDKAIDAAAEEIGRNRDTVARELGEHYGAIFAAHLQMVLDEQLRAGIESHIRQNLNCAELAVSRSLRRYAKVFESLGDSQFAQRSHDIVDIEKRLLRHLIGLRRDDTEGMPENSIVMARALTPSETANLDRTRVLGFATEVGGPGSHTAIVAEGLGIPAVVGIGPFLADVADGTRVIIDGDQGLVIVDPDEDVIRKYELAAEERKSLTTRLDVLKELPAKTVDGERIQLWGNIEFPHEAAECLAKGGDGIGLYRTEFLYLGSDREPTEEDQYEAYSSVVREMGGRPVVIRTLDLGADKLARGINAEAEKNPFLGLRSIRLSLHNLPLFRTQLRAILRASALGDIRIMFPMVTTIMEFRQAKMVLGDVMEDLDEQGVPFNHDIPLGMMLEVPAAVMMIDTFVREVDFVSIGTNDLIQYTLAVDRSNKDVASMYTAAEPSVLRLIERAIRSCREAGVPVSLCGQMSGSKTYTMLLLGMGMRLLSATPSVIPELKLICRSVTIAQCEEVTERVMQMENARNIKLYLRQRLKSLVPEVVREGV
jgi:phosphotransferase system enzyme I (PtsI)